MIGLHSRRGHWGMHAQRMPSLNCAALIPSMSTTNCLVRKLIVQISSEPECSALVDRSAVSRPIREGISFDTGVLTTVCNTLRYGTASDFMNRPGHDGGALTEAARFSSSSASGHRGALLRQAPCPARRAGSGVRPASKTMAGPSTAA